MGGLLLYVYLQKKNRSGVAALVTIGAPVVFDQPEQEPMKTLLKLDENPTLKKIFLYLNVPSIGPFLVPLVSKVEKLFYNPENIEENIKAKFLEIALANLNPGVLNHLLQIIRKGEFVSAQGDVNYRKKLSRIRTPTLLIGGEKDLLAPPKALEATRSALGSKDRTLRIFGTKKKDSADYGHFDLILGKKSRQEVFPVIARWLKGKTRQK
jgi:pimeloyl-ACP methyl ester carboxylesterase